MDNVKSLAITVFITVSPFIFVAYELGRFGAKLAGN